MSAMGRKQSSAASVSNGGEQALRATTTTFGRMQMIGEEREPCQYRTSALSMSTANTIMVASDKATKTNVLWVTRFNSS
jgi:hypothetical protein